MSTQQDTPQRPIVEQVEASFAERYEAGPGFRSFAPGRVNLIGDHTDYNAGYALPIAINEGVAIAGERVSEGHERAHLNSLGFGSVELNIEHPHRHDPGWERYAAGVLNLVTRRLGPIQSFRAVVGSSVPVGAGLSSSAAFAIALVRFAESLVGRELDLLVKARLCQQAEHEYAGVPCGLLDQLAILNAQPSHATLLDCRTLGAAAIPIDLDQIAILIVHSGVERSLAGSVYRERVEACERAARLLGVTDLRDLDPDPPHAQLARLPESLAARVRHVVTENARVHAFARALRDQQWAVAGEAMFASHQSLRDDYQVSCPELDAIVDQARSIGLEGGVYGCRMTGGGQGGCAVALVERSRAESLQDRFRACHHERERRLVLTI